MGLYSVKPAFQRFLAPAKNALVKRRIGPTAVNVAGTVSSVMVATAIMLSPDMPAMLIVVPIGAFVRTACNALDGLIARELHIASAFGEVLNEFLDRINDALIFGALALLPTVDMRLGLGALTLILLNSYLSILSKAAGGARRYEGVLGKADRMLWLGLAAVLIAATGRSDWWNGFLLFIAAGTLITLCTRFSKTRQELRGRA